ncbi:MAG TPA: formate dehydrogenase accessory sulfurtransferase FdhD [Anaerolineales bacterium]
MADGTVTFDFSTFDGDWQTQEAEVIEEGQVTLFVNGRELATLMCTPRDPAQLALGFLANEDLVSTLREVEILHVCQGGGCVDAWLSHPGWDKPRRKIITSGCSGGQTFSDLQAQHTPLHSDLLIEPQKLAWLLAQLQDHNSLYARARGVHTSALSDGENLVLVAEDIGRHNTLDRLRGECLRRGLDPAGMILLSTGRISSEMIHKAVKMGCPVVGSRTSPTSLSVNLARAWNMTLCGYIRRNRMNVYAHPERLLGYTPDAAEPADPLFTDCIISGSEGIG